MREPVLYLSPDALAATEEIGLRLVDVESIPVEALPAKHVLLVGKEPDESE